MLPCPGQLFYSLPGKFLFNWEVSFSGVRLLCAAREKPGPKEGQWVPSNGRCLFGPFVTMGLGHGSSFIFMFQIV